MPDKNRGARLHRAQLPAKCLVEQGLKEGSAYGPEERAVLNGSDTHIIRLRTTGGTVQCTIPLCKALQSISASDYRSISS